MTTNFEAKLHGFRRTQDGVVVSYVVHPSDVSAELATAALGTRYMVAVAEIGDDERPVAQKAAEDNLPNAKPVAEQLDDAGSSPAGQPPKKRFIDYSLPEQIGMLCADVRFQKFLHVNDADAAAENVRVECGVKSRRDIQLDTPAFDAWVAIYDQFQFYLTDQNYAGAVR